MLSKHLISSSVQLSLLNTRSTLKNTLPELHLILLVSDFNNRAGDSPGRHFNSYPGLDAVHTHKKNAHRMCTTKL